VVGHAVSGAPGFDSETWEPISCDQLDWNHCLEHGLGLGDRRNDGVAALLAIREPDRSTDLGAGQVLEALEVFLCIIEVAGPLHGASHLELARCVVGIDLNSLLEDGNGLVVLLELGVAGAQKIIRVGVAWIELDCLLKALERLFRFVAGVLGESKVVPGLRALRV